MNFIRIKNWAEYQHYRDRSAPWVKLHKELLSSHFWVMGNDASRLLAICLMLLAQRTDNKIPADKVYVQRFGHLDQEPDFKPLIDAQLIEFIDDANCLQDASNILVSGHPEERRGEDIEIPEKSISKPKSPKAKQNSIPPDFVISEAVQKWATKDGHTRLAERLEHFIGYAKSSGKTYADWDQAFMNAIRDDWAKLGKTVAPGPVLPPVFGDGRYDAFMRKQVGL